MFLSNNVAEENQRRLNNMLGFTRVTDLGTYLGITFFHGRVGVSAF